ncbi:NAD(P)H-hydrate dehydratase [Neolewinella antarctica]|uniref:Bifunctional NAD(P)H-hydrate repair enzyme n=1 Tax=Neolewinella antarctica TaxID=442734 RepID=A0ABX0X6T9_9BACT|nr:NAD(P)H-hydrate dehydratase [Neolewinella antarctica]NJC24847.1 NAD(P)H-hydrate epimerase [Neolewinella antarctica]
MQILSGQQLRALDEMTVHEEGITSLELMERAVTAFTGSFCKQFRPSSGPILIVCGTGNNGGDGFATARQLHRAGYNTHVVAAEFGKRSPDNQANFNAAKRLDFPFTLLRAGNPFPKPAPGVILIDALLGTGLSRPLEGYWAELIERWNETEDITRVALDVPSGLPADGPATGAVFMADHTFVLGYPKVAIFAPENAVYVGEMSLVKFKLSSVRTVLHVGPEGDIRPNQMLTEGYVATLVKKRGNSDHKGTFGHALLVAGSFGKMGAAVIAARAVLRAGAGLVTCHVPRSGYEIMQISFPEAMCTVDAHWYQTTGVGDLSQYATIGIGPGLGTEQLTAAALRDVLTRYAKPLVIDADALNLIAQSPSLFALIPKGSILTPHPKEFERLFGKTADSFARWRVQGEAAKRNELVILLKTNHTTIATPTGKIYVNTTGNPGMGTAGTGDALTGILTGLLAQGYEPATAATLGVYLHGLAGDLAAEALSQEFLLAEDVVNHVGAAYQELARVRN